MFAADIGFGCWLYDSSIWIPCRIPHTFCPVTRWNWTAVWQIDVWYESRNMSEIWTPPIERELHSSRLGEGSADI